MAASRVRVRLALLAAVLPLALAAAVTLLLHRLDRVTGALDSVVMDRLTPLRQLDDIYQHAVEAPDDLVALVRARALAPEDGARRLDEGGRRVADQWSRYRATQMVPEEKVLIAEIEPMLERVDDARKRLVQLLRGGDPAAAAAYADRELAGRTEPLGLALRRLAAVQEPVARRAVDDAKHDLSDTRWSVATLLVLATALGVALTGWVGHGVRRDLAQREQAARRLGAMYAALSRTNRLIVRAREERTLFAELCSICTEALGAKTAVVMMRDRDDGVSIAASAGPAREMFDKVTLRFDAHPPRMPAVVALREGRIVVSNDYLADPDTASAHDRARAAGVAAAAVLPIRRGGQVVGCFNLYVDRKGYFDDGLVALLEEMARDLSFALDRFDRDARQERAEKAVQTAYRSLRALFDGLPIAVAVESLDDCRLVEVNAMFCTRYGLAREQLLGRTMDELGLGAPPVERARLHAAVRAAGSVRDFAAISHDADGRPLALQVSGTLIDYQGVPSMLIASLDMTERGRRETEGRARAADEAAGRARAEFVAQLGHRLRAPLNVLLAATQTLHGDTRLDAQQRAQLQAIRDAGAQVLALTADVLDVSRTDGTPASTLHAVALLPLLDEALQQAQPLARPRAVVLQAPPRQSVTQWLQGEPLQLRQVLLDLATHAVVHSADGGTVRFETEALDAHVVLRAVVRGGTGAADGAALAATRQRVQALQGRLDVFGQPGGGTTLALTLRRGTPPLPLPPVPAAAAAAAPAPADDDDAMALQGTVLYIEDNPVNVMLIEELLRRWPGVRFEAAIDGTRGVARARELLPDLLLLDMHLPDMDGFAVMKALREQPGTAALRVVLLSADAQPEAVQRARADGALDYWTKPIDMERFVHHVRRLLAPAA